MDHDRVQQARILRVKAFKCRRWADTACDSDAAARLTAMASEYDGQAEALDRDAAASPWTRCGR